MCRSGKCKLCAHKKIASLKGFSLRLSGMRMTYEYEAVCHGETTTLARYVFRYGKGEEREQNAVAEVETSDVLGKLNELGIGSWDGFFGSHPKNVSDGEMFEFRAETDEEKPIRASGSANFPPRYGELKDWLSGLLPW